MDASVDARDTTRADLPELVVYPDVGSPPSLGEAEEAAVNPNGDTSPDPQGRRFRDNDASEVVDLSQATQALEDIGSMSETEPCSQQEQDERDPETLRAMAGPEQGEPNASEDNPSGNLPGASDSGEEPETAGLRPPAGGQHTAPGPETAPESHAVSGPETAPEAEITLEPETVPEPETTPEPLDSEGTGTVGGPQAAEPADASEGPEATDTFNDDRANDDSSSGQLRNDDSGSDRNGSYHGGTDGNGHVDNGSDDSGSHDNGSGGSSSDDSVGDDATVMDHDADLSRRVPSSEQVPGPYDDEPGEQVSWAFDADEDTPIGLDEPVATAAPMEEPVSADLFTPGIDLFARAAEEQAEFPEADEQDFEEQDHQEPAPFAPELTTAIPTTGSKEPLPRAPGHRAPGHRALDHRAPGRRAPDSPAPESIVGDRAATDESVTDDSVRDEQATGERIPDGEQDAVHAAAADPTQRRRTAPLVWPSASNTQTAVGGEPAPASAAPSAPQAGTDTPQAPPNTPQARPSTPSAPSMPRRPVVDHRPFTADELVEQADVLAPYAQRSGTPPEALTDLLSSVEALREQVAELSLILECEGTDQTRTERDNLLAQLDDYVLPRLRRMDAPLLAVIGGSTGAGKSTLVNSLVRREVSRSGVLRPTTRSPVLVHHPYDSGAFLSQRILPGLARITESSLEPLQPIELDAPRATALRLVSHEGLCPGLAIVDAPDIDSVIEANRDLAGQLLGAADLWLFVTTAARYGDALPWKTLREAVERGVTVAVILDRVPRESLREIRTQLAGRLREGGLGSSPVFVVPEIRPVGGLLPYETVAPLLSWLNRLARDARSRDVVVRRTLAGALDSLPERIALLAEAADAQMTSRTRLGQELETGIVRSLEDLAISLADSTVLRGEILARWRELLSGGELMNASESATSRLRNLVRRTRPLPSEPLVRALRAGVGSLLRASVQEATDSVLNAWRDNPAGRRLVQIAERRPADGRIPTLLAMGPTNASTAQEEEFDLPVAEPDDEITVTVDEWYAMIVELARAEGGRRRATSRAASLGVGGAAALAVMLAVASPTSGADDGAVLASGEEDAARVARRILESVLGEQSTRAIVSRARRDLLQRAQTLIETEHVRLYEVLQTSGARLDQGKTLREAAQMVEEAR